MLVEDGSFTLIFQLLKKYSIRVMILSDMHRKIREFTMESENHWFGSFLAFLAVILVTK